MLRTLDVILIVLMTAVAAVTYSIKHRAEQKLDEVKKIEAEIQLEKDTIDLLRADWALLTQPHRLQTLITSYQTQLQLLPTESTQLVTPAEMPMLRSQLPVFDPADADKDGKVTDKEARRYAAKLLGESTDNIQTGSVND
jgi:hypothetical protein